MSAQAPRGLVDRIALTWRDPRAAARLECETADESRIVFYAVAAAVLATMQKIGVHRLEAGPVAEPRFDEWAATQMAAGFLLPVALYAAAALFGLACRAAGGRGSWRETRAATMWTALAAQPPAMLLALLAAAAVGLGGAPQWLGAAGAASGSVIWALMLAPALAEAHGFRSSLPVLGAFGAVAAVAALAVP